MSELGIYFGPKVIEVTQSKSRKLTNNVEIPLLEITGNELDEKVPAEIKIVAAFNDAFRRNKIGAKEAVLCLSGKDLIIRTFEIPVLPKEELKGAISFEAKKYMPFKVEDLISDFQLEQDKASNTNMVLFMGIKKETFDKYFSILNQLNIKVSSIEYAGFSVLRMLKASGIKDNGVLGVICFDSQAQDEINFTVLENGFPLFSRDINLSSAQEGFEKPEAGSQAVPLDKLKAEIRVSLDYYHRKFSSKNIQNVVLICGMDWRQDVEFFISELGLSSKFVDIAKVIGKPIAYSSNFAKSYSSSVAKDISTKIKINLAESRAKAARPSAGVDAAALLKGLKIDLRIVVLGGLICAAAFGYGIYQSIPLKQELAVVIGKRRNVAGIASDASYSTLTASSVKYGKTLENLDNLIKKQLYITEPLNILPAILPEGVWLTRFNFGSESGGSELLIEGMCYLGDSDKEFEAVNALFSSLNGNSAFRKYFKDIGIVSIDRAEFEQKAVTKFLVSCKSAGKGKQ
jgi:hypothetical protein